MKERILLHVSADHSANQSLDARLAPWGRLVSIIPPKEDRLPASDRLKLICNRYPGCCLVILDAASFPEAKQIEYQATIRSFGYQLLALVALHQDEKAGNTSIDTQPSELFLPRTVTSDQIALSVRTLLEGPTSLSWPEFQALRVALRITTPTTLSPIVFRRAVVEETPHPPQTDDAAQDKPTIPSGRTAISSKPEEANSEMETSAAGTSKHHNRADRKTVTRHPTVRIGSRKVALESVLAADILKRLMSASDRVVRATELMDSGGSARASATDVKHAICELKSALHQQFFIGYEVVSDRIGYRFRQLF